MALGDAYATASQYRAAKKGNSSSDDTVIGRDLKAVSRYIDKMTHRRMGFNVDASDIARVYDIDDASMLLPIFDTVSITTVEIDETRGGTWTALAATDWELLPLNAASDPEPRPYYELGALPTGQYSKGWARGGRMRITGKCGWPAVPDAIVSACIELTAIFRIETPRATSQVNEVGQVLSTNAQARGIVAELVHTYSRFAELIV